MVVRKLNYYKLISFVAVTMVIIVLIVLGIIKFVHNINYKKSNEYKLISIGYSQDETNELLKNLKDEDINKLLTFEYNRYITDLSKEKYFIFSNLDKYIEYEKANKKEELSKVVAIINTEANVEWIDEEKQTDVSKETLMMVNRLYGLKKSYKPKDIVDVPTQYAYAGKKISKTILDPIIELIKAGKEEGYTFVVSEGYRSYNEQKKTYDLYKNSWGIEEADKYVARPGHSDYQTGYAFDLQPYNKVISNPTTSKEYKWLYENAHNYGFIFRLESEKEFITKFSASPWRLRYVGVDAATVMYDEKLCFEEYYAYYVIGG